jgi:26 proteasome complex subunit DSS1
MSTPGQPETAKATVSDSKDDTKPLQPQKPAAQLEEDDEFEDFPVEGRTFIHDEKSARLTSGLDWAKEEEVGAQGQTTHLWEESWDDDDTSDDFSVQLKCVPGN